MSAMTLTDAERALYEGIEDSGDTQGLAYRVAQTVAEAVGRERAAWVAKIEDAESRFVARYESRLPLGHRPYVVPMRDAARALRGLLAADDTEAGR